MTENDEIYYKHGAKFSLSQSVVKYARKKMYAHFMKTVQPTKGTKILDFGVSEFITDESNFLEKNYPHHEDLTCVGIGDGKQVKQHFPNVNYFSLIPNEKLPFDDNSFDVSYSNAVFEHLDTDALRVFFFNELARVSKRVYITIPNRWFPVEHHTAVPLLHYIPSLFRKFLSGGEKDFWAQQENLAFLGKKELAEVAKSHPVKIAYSGIFLGPMSSNISIWTDK